MTQDLKRPSLSIVTEVPSSPWPSRCIFFPGLSIHKNHSLICFFFVVLYKISILVPNQRPILSDESLKTVCSFVHRPLTQPNILKSGTVLGSVRVMSSRHLVLLRPACILHLCQEGWLLFLAAFHTSLLSLLLVHLPFAETLPSSC